MKVLVCGGRDFDNFDYLCGVLDTLHKDTPITELIHGQARGADNQAAAWAARKDIPRRAFPADWTKHGKAAGPIRNKQMLADGKPDLVVAFRGGRGTANMIKQAEAAGVPVRFAR